MNRLRPAGAIVLAAGIVGILSPVAPVATASSVGLHVETQSVSLEPDQPIVVVVRLVGTVPAETEMVVTAHRVIVDRRTMQAAIDGSVGPVVDRVTVPLSGLPRTTEGFVEVTVPTTSDQTTSSDRAAGVLGLARAGVHPLTLQLRSPESGATLGEAVTFVHMEPEGGSRGALEVAYVARITAHPTRRPDGGTTVEPAARAQLERLVDLLEKTPATFSLTLAPELLEGLSRSTDDDVALLRRLDVALGGRELLAEPYVTIDPSGAARSALLDTFTRQLRAGEDATAAILPRHLSRRSVHLVDGTIDGAGASLLRDLGMRSLVLTPSAQSLLNIPVDLVDHTQLVDLRIGIEATMPAALVDPVFAETLAAPVADPERAAFLVVMELLATRAQVLSELGTDNDALLAASALAGRTVTLSTPDGSVGNPDLIARVLDLVDATPGLGATTATIAGTITDTATIDGQEGGLALPPVSGPDLDVLADRLYTLTLDAATIGSMLPPDDPRPARWDDLILVMPAVELSAAELDGFEATVRRDLDEIRSAIGTPPVSDVTLGGRRSTIRLKVRNDADVPLTVSVRLESSKLSFPRGEEVVTLAPFDVTEVEIPVEARTNGRFPVSVTLLTPFGDVPLHPPVEFAARVNAITGLGQAVTAAAVLILVSWWVHHLRTRRRVRRVAATLDPS